MELTRQSREPFACLRVGNLLTARNHPDFVLAVRGLYGDRIRGARAPASLKRIPARRPGAARARHPGRARPGLMEAVPDGGFVLRLDPHPGRARPGLIEAKVR